MCVLLLNGLTDVKELSFPSKFSLHKAAPCINLAAQLLFLLASLREMYCPCGFLPVQRTSWTESNYGRRFLGCVYGAKGCNFFRWVDPPTCSRCCSMVPGLLLKISAHEEQILKLEQEKKGVKRMYMMVLVFLCVVWFFSR